MERFNGLDANNIVARPTIPGRSYGTAPVPIEIASR